MREEAVTLHNQARDGDENSSIKAIEKIERYLKEFPEDGEAWAYLGSAYSIAGRDASSVVDKIRYTNRGISHLDRALEINPQNFIVRFIRAKVNSSVPKMFDRKKKAVDDMLALDKMFQKKPSVANATLMIDVYDDLQDYAPDSGPWKERLESVRKLSDKE